MINNDLSAVVAKIHDNTPFDNHKGRIADVEVNTKETEAKIEGIEQNNKIVSQKIENETKKFDAESDSQVRKALMMQLNSPFPMMSTEVRLKTI